MRKAQMYISIIISIICLAMSFTMEEVMDVTLMKALALAAILNFARLFSESSDSEDEKIKTSK